MWVLESGEIVGKEMEEARSMDGQVMEDGKRANGSEGVKKEKRGVEIRVDKGGIVRRGRW